jgi:hypothetical protein
VQEGPDIVTIAVATSADGFAKTEILARVKLSHVD